MTGPMKLCCSNAGHSVILPRRSQRQDPAASLLDGRGERATGRPSSGTPDKLLGGMVVAIATTDKGNLCESAQSCGSHGATAFVRGWGRNIGEGFHVAQWRRRAGASLILLARCCTVTLIPGCISHRAVRCIKVFRYAFTARSGWEIRARDGGARQTSAAFCDMGTRTVCTARYRQAIACAPTIPSLFFSLIFVVFLPF
ncbi:unnamed protein product [Sphacelaria rigidula]